MLDDFSNWLLPLDYRWFFLIIIGTFVLTITMWITTYCQTVQGDGKIHRLMFRTTVCGFMALVFLISLIGSISWCIYANNQVPEVAFEKKLEIKLVTYPDGKTVQMFHSNGVNYNVNQMFGCMAPPEGYIRRVSYKRVYAGVSFPTPAKSQKDAFGDDYYLVSPDSMDKKALLVSPVD